MQILLDHVSATIIASIVFVLLMALQARVNESTVERTILYMGKKQTLNLGEILERDLENAGFGTLPGEEGILEHANRIVGPTTFTERLTFPSADQNGNPMVVRYQIAVTDTIEIDGDDVPLLSFTREEDTGTGFQPAGGSAATLTDFDVDLLSLQNVGTTRDVARKLRVRFKNALVGRSNPWTQDQATIRKRFLNELMWGMTIEPPALKFQGFQG